MARRKQLSLRVSSCPILRMPKWWPEFAREAGINVTKETAIKCEDCGQRESISLPRGSPTFPSSDSNIPISLIVPSTLPTSQEEKPITRLTDGISSSLPTRIFPENTFVSESLGIESQDRLWKVETILQKRTDRGRGMYAKRAIWYNGRPVSCLLRSSTMHRRLGRLSRPRRTSMQEREEL